MNITLSNVVPDVYVPSAFRQLAKLIEQAFALINSPISWGQITGTLSNQTDLYAAITAAKRTAASRLYMHDNFGGF